MVTAERFGQGMTFDEYVTYTASAGNLKRETTGGAPRKDQSGFLREAYGTAHLSEAQQQAWKWLVSQPGGPAKILVISEEWSSDCRRDVPMLARLAEKTGMELRIFPRDGNKFSAAAAPDPKESPNADLMAQFLNRRDGHTYQSIPVVAFYTRDMQHLYTYTEYPACYRKDNHLAVIRGARPGETPEQTKTRADREFAEMLGSPFFHLWRCAAVDEMASMLYERLRVGTPA
jgi:thiol-disulfide isomerase/thioredoxin